MNLEEMPIPDYKTFLSKIHYQKRRRFIGGYAKEMSILSSRGCPYKCEFCSTAKFREKFRFRNYKHVAEEINRLYTDFKVKHIGFWDDLFTANILRMELLRNELKNKGILDDLTIIVQSRANLVNDKQMQVLKSLNTKYVGFGFESGSDRYLRYLK